MNLMEDTNRLQQICFLYWKHEGLGFFLKTKISGLFAFGSGEKCGFRGMLSRRGMMAFGAKVN